MLCAKGQEPKGKGGTLKIQKDRGNGWSQILQEKRNYGIFRWRDETCFLLAAGGKVEREQERLALSWY